MYHEITVTPRSFEREMLQCYADLHHHHVLASAILAAAIETVERHLRDDPQLQEAWQRHLRDLADRAARWDSVQAERFSASLVRAHDDELTAAGNS